MPRRTAEDAAKTRAQLVRQGVRYFTRHPYAEASLEDLVRGLGVTRGALYHHFGTKDGFFETVVEHVMERLAKRILDEAGETSSDWEGLVAGSEAFVDAATDDAFRQIALVDAPAALGWQRWKEIDERTTSRTLHQGLIELRKAGELRSKDVDALTRALSGAMNELALWVASASDPHKAARRAKTVIREMLDALHS